MYVSERVPVCACGLKSTEAGAMGLSAGGGGGTVDSSSVHSSHSSQERQRASSC